MQFMAGRLNIFVIIWNWLVFLVPRVVLAAHRMVGVAERESVVSLLRGAGGTASDHAGLRARPVADAVLSATHQIVLVVAVQLLCAVLTVSAASGR